MSSDGQPNSVSEHSKRGRPCDACRKRKSRCVTKDDETVCVLCNFHGQKCTYEEDPKPRKRNASRDEVAISASSPPKRSKTIRTNPGTGIEEYDDLPGPSLLKRTLGLQNIYHSRYIGINDTLDVYGIGSINHGSSERQTKSDGQKITARFVHPAHAFQIEADANTDDYGREKNLIEEIESTVEPNGLNLVQLYFRIVHPSYPILHREVFLEKYARSYREFSPPLLAAVYLLASAYWNFSESLSDSPKPDLQKLRQLAFESLTSTIKRPKLSTVQAALLLSQYEAVDKSSWTKSHYGKLTVQLVDLAHGLGLHIDPSSWAIPDWEIGLRRRLGWAVFVQDKWTALIYGRPALMQSHDWAVLPLNATDFPEIIEDDQEGSSEVDKGRIVFMQMASLTVILSDILISVFSVRAQQALEESSDKLTLLLSNIKPLQLKLKAWFTSLPESLKMDSATSMKLSSVGYLRLAYLTIESCVHRQIIRTLSPVADSQSTVGIFRICRAAAQERFVNAVEFLQRLQAHHIASFWYFTSAKSCALIFCLGRMLECSASDEKEVAYYRQKIKEFRWALKVNSDAGTGFLKNALRLIDTSVRVLPAEAGAVSAETSPSAWSYVDNYTVSPGWMDENLAGSQSLAGNLDTLKPSDQDWMDYAAVLEGIAPYKDDAFVPDNGELSKYRFDVTEGHPAGFSFLS